MSVGQFIVEMCARVVCVLNRSGNTAFMNDANSFLLNFTLVDAQSEAVGSEWAQPHASHLRGSMRRVFHEATLWQQHAAGWRRTAGSGGGCAGWKVPELSAACMNAVEQQSSNHTHIDNSSPTDSASQQVTGSAGHPHNLRSSEHTVMQRLCSEQSVAAVAARGQRDVHTHFGQQALREKVVSVCLWVSAGRE